MAECDYQHGSRSCKSLSSRQLIRPVPSIQPNPSVLIRSSQSGEQQVQAGELEIALTYLILFEYLSDLSTILSAAMSVLILSNLFTVLYGVLSLTNMIWRIYLI